MDAQIVIDWFVKKNGTVEDWNGEREAWNTALGCFYSGWLAREESGLTMRAADTAPRCPNCGSPLSKDETRERSYICSNSGACR